MTKLPALGFAFLQLLDEIFLGDDAAVKFQSLGDQRRVLRFQLFLCLKKKNSNFKFNCISSPSGGTRGSGTFFLFLKSFLFFEKFRNELRTSGQPKKCLFVGFDFDCARIVNFPPPQLVEMIVTRSREQVRSAFTGRSSPDQVVFTFHCFVDSVAFEK